MAINLSKLFKKIQPKNCFIGFDGFTDEIISVVEKILDSDSQTYFQTIESFGKKLTVASNKSCNFELVVKQTKLGGNAPIFTNALLEGGHTIVFAGAIGKGKVEPLFKEMAERCSQHFPLASSAKTEALEFKDGKIILGKMASLKKITFDLLISKIGEKNFFEILDQSHLFVSANWTMLPNLTGIWKNILKLAPNFYEKDFTRILFVDLADPSKRTDEDLKEALITLSQLNTYYNVIVGLNIAEAEIISKLFEIDYQSQSIQAIKDSTLKLFDQLKIFRLIVHHSKFAISQDIDDQIHIPTIHVEKPVLTTGAGDNFNAGYCNGLLYELEKKDILMAAVVTAGFYVRFGHSPSMQELEAFCAENT